MAHVPVGNGLLSSRICFSDPSLREIWDIQEVNFDANGSLDLVIVGSAGAAVLDRAFKPIEQITFHDRAFAKVKLVDLEHNGHYEFLVRGSSTTGIGLSWDCPVIVFDRDGSRMWSYRSVAGVNDAAAADIDGDGQDEVVVGMNTGGGIKLLNHNGSELWSKPDANAWRVETLSSQSGHGLDIVSSNASGELTLRDAAGEVIRRIKPGAYLRKFSKTKWFGLEGNDQILAIQTGKILVIDPLGKTLASWNAPLAGSSGEPVGTPVKLSGEKDYYACLVTFDDWNRSILYMYEEDGTLVYQEIFGSGAGCLFPFNGSLLVGFPGKVMMFEMAKPVQGSSAPASTEHQEQGK